MLSSEPVSTAASLLSDASSMSTAQSAVSLVGVVRLDNVDVDLGLCWDPLVTDSDVLAELLADRHLTPGQTNSTSSL